MVRPKHITIAGAGLVGSLLAVILNRRGYRVTIFEKRPDLRTSDISAGRSINLALANRGTHALRLAGLMHDVETLLIPMRGRMLHEWGEPAEFWPYGQREHEVIYSVSRGELNNLMMTAAETECLTQIHFSHEIQSVDFEKNEFRVLDHQTGNTRIESFEYLIGADGGGSEVRQALVDAADGSFTAEMLDHDYKELEIPAGPGNTFQIEKEALHIWPRGGFMLIALPNLDGSFTVTLFMPSQGEISFEKLTDPDVVIEFFREQFPSAIEFLPFLAEDFFSNPTGELGTIRCDTWVYRNSMLLGDAAHAIVPFHGQGMNCGFEDCAKLNDLLDQYDDDWEVAAAEFEKARKPNADAIADMALENYVIMRDSVSDAEFQLKKEIGFKLEQKFPQQFIPRYSMVMFHDIPYAEALHRGKIQDEIMNQIIRGNDPNDIDMTLAERLIQAELSPLEFAF